MNWRKATTITILGLAGCAALGVAGATALEDMKDTAFSHEVNTLSTIAMRNAAGDDGKLSRNEALGLMKALGAEPLAGFNGEVYIRPGDRESRKVYLVHHGSRGEETLGTTSIEKLGRYAKGPSYTYKQRLF